MSSERHPQALLTTTSINRGTYAMFFDQRGLMAGRELQSSKITRIDSGRRLTFPLSHRPSNVTANKAKPDVTSCNLS